MFKNIFFGILIIAAAIFVPQAKPAVAQSPTSTPAPELAYYDAQIDVLIPRLVEFQNQYHDLTGHYFQSLESNSTAPDVPIEPDGLSGAPSDQADDLAYFWINGAELPSTLAWSFSINTYAGPDGDGYVLVINTSLNGETWKRAINLGPEEWRSFDWMKYIPSEW